MVDRRLGAACSGGGRCRGSRGNGYYVVGMGLERAARMW